MPVGFKLLIVFLFSVDYQAASLGGNQMDKKNKYIFAKFSNIENSKK